MSHGDKVNSNNKVDLGSTYYFEKLVYDTIVELNNDIRKKKKKAKWYYLPTIEHLEFLISKFEFPIEFVECDDYVKIRLKGGEKNGK